MLRIAKLTDYGVIVATHMATHTHYASANDIAEATGISLPTTSKVLKTLAKGGIVMSQRGAQGGYQLTRPAHSISVAQLVTALEGPIAITECSLEGDSNCTLDGQCNAQANWQYINRSIHRALEAVTLADMARDTQHNLISLKRTSKAS